MPSTSSRKSISALSCVLKIEKIPLKFRIQSKNYALNSDLCRDFDFGLKSMSRIFDPYPNQCLLISVLYFFKKIDFIAHFSN
jgi:hypothetical protein